ncbi:MAG: hypothetical protein ACXV7F_11270, partial [Methylomonas sp.]
MICQFSRGVLLAALICRPSVVYAELVVIVNAGRHVERVSRDEIINIFMGRYRKLADGDAALPLEVKGDGRRVHRRVRTSGPPTLMAMVSSKWAA